MIRIDLVDNTSSVKHVDFRVVPVTTKKDFTCIPEGILPLRVVVRLSRRSRGWAYLRRNGQVPLVSAERDASGQAQEPNERPTVKDLLVRASGHINTEMKVMKRLYLVILLLGGALALPGC